eukprot:9475851-Pyramimonas_sp.AAC.1
MSQGSDPRDAATAADARLGNAAGVVGIRGVSVRGRGGKEAGRERHSPVLRGRWRQRSRRQVRPSRAQGTTVAGRRRRTASCRAGSVLVPAAVVISAAAAITTAITILLGRTGLGELL